MIVNALLVCWNGGWFRLDDPAAISAAGYRAEGFLSLGAQYDEGEAYRQAQQVLADYRETRVGIETRIDPAPHGQGAAAPYQGWRPTNTIQVAGQTHRVRSMRVQLTDDGPEFTPGFGRRAPSESDRLVTAVKKFSPGVMAGDTPLPTPMSAFNAGAAVEADAGGGGCEMFAAQGIYGAYIDVEFAVPQTVYVTAVVSGVSEKDASEWSFWPVVPPPPPVDEFGYWQYNGPAVPVFHTVFDATPWYQALNATLTFAYTVPAGEWQIGAALIGAAYEDEDEDPGVMVNVNMMVCPSDGANTVRWDWVIIT